jgi:hypothetical protein
VSSMDDVTATQPGSVKRFAGVWIEPAVALVATAFIAVLLVLTALNAGPLWRDETASVNVAQMPSLNEFWSNLKFELFPALWMLVLRGWSSLGLTANDRAIRFLGLFFGFGFLGSLWVCVRWVCRRAPTVGLALLGTLPAFLAILGANRPYGFAISLLVLCFGLIWRVLESPSIGRIILAGAASILFAQCVYYDAIFLCAMLLGAALVVIRRKQWNVLVALVSIGTLAGASVLPYVPLLTRSSPWVRIFQPPFDFWAFWGKLCQAVTARSSANITKPAGPQIWIWLVLTLAALVTSVWIQRRYTRDRDPLTPQAQIRADLAVYSGASVLGGVALYVPFLLRVRFSTESWYYMEMLVLAAISLEAITLVKEETSGLWSLARIALLVLMFAWSGDALWDEAHTRRTNVDLIATKLAQDSEAGDLIVVNGAWEGITFDRYYHGRAAWLTIPPIDSHKVHRTDLLWQKLNDPDPIAPVLREVSSTLQSGHRVWTVGPAEPVKPGELVTRPGPMPAIARPPNLPTGWWLGPYLNHWAAQLRVHLLGRARWVAVVETPQSMPVSSLENLCLLEFSGYRSGPEDFGR